MEDAPSDVPYWFMVIDLNGDDKLDVAAFIDWDRLHHPEVNEAAHQALAETCDSAVRSSISPSYPDDLDISSKASPSHRSDSDVSEFSIGLAEVKPPITFHEDPTSPVSSNGSVDVEHQEHENDQEKPQEFSRPVVQLERAEDELIDHDVDHHEDRDVEEPDLNDEHAQQRSGDAGNKDLGDQATQAHLGGRSTEDLDLTGAMRVVLARARRICRKRRHRNPRRMVGRRR